MRYIYALLGLTPLLLATGPLKAEAGTSAEPLEGDIIVTARLRREPLNSVPIPISVLGGKDADDKNLHTIGDLASIAPGLTFRTGASNKDRTIFIRGIGTITTSPGVESSVSTVVDGVLLVRPGQQTLEIADIDRIEILRGPQGTLFGKNASAGVVSVITADPTGDRSLTASASYFTDDERRLKVSIDAPLVEDLLGFRLSALWADYDGNVFNRVTQQHINGYERRGVRGKLVITPSANLRLTAIGDFAYEKGSVPNAIFYGTSRAAFGTGIVTPSTTLPPALAAEGIHAGPENRTTSTPWDSSVQDRNYGGSLQADWQISPTVSLVSISAYREWKNWQHLDMDGLSMTYAGLNGVNDDGRVWFNQFSQETRVKAAPIDGIDLVAGVYYLRTETQERYVRDVAIFTGGNPDPAQGVADYDVHTRHLAAFGEASVAIGPRVKLFAGGRLIRDSLSYSHVRTPSMPAGAFGIFPYHASSSHTVRTDYAARVGLQYQVGPELNGYLTLSRGYKGPAYNVFFNMRDLDEVLLAPEVAQSVDAGLKGNIRSLGLSFSLAAFYTRFDNFQANFIDLFRDTIVVRLINAGRVSTRGVELEASWGATPSLQLTTRAAWTDARIDHFLCPSASPSCTTYSVDGQPLPFAPKLKLFQELRKSWSIGSSRKLTFATDISYTSKQQFQLDERPDTIQPGYALLNASLVLTFPNNGLEFRLIGKNLTDKSYSSYLQGSSTGGGLFRFVPRDDRRYFGMAATWRL